VVIDAIQGLGAFRQTLEPADVLVAGGQKWLRAGWGSGLMAVGERALERLEPTLTGWWGVEGFLDTERPPLHEPRPGAARYQEGTPPIVGAVQLRAAIEVIEIAGIDAVETAIRERVAGIEDAVRAAGAEVLAPWRTARERAGILSFRLPGEDPAETARRLLGGGVVLSRRGAWLRAAPHASTGPEAVEMLRAAL
jgi:selenocysteine lyase/cysteine desulfurase